jgi:hypothetical protein
VLVPIRSLSVEVIPQAIIGLPIHEVVGKWLDKGYDDLDYFMGASFRFDDEVEIAVRHYQGYPEGTSTIYIDSKVKNVEVISGLVRRILDNLKIPTSALQWERANDPDL